MAHTQITRLIELGVANVNINARDVGLALAALAQESARTRVAAEAPEPITDSSSGAPDDALNLVVLPTKVAKDGSTTLVQKEEFDNATSLIDEAHAELANKTNQLITLIAGTTARKIDVGSFNNVTTDGTIETTEPVSGDLTNLVAADDALAQLVIARNKQASISAAVNYCRIAMGLDTLPDNTGGVFDITESHYATAAVSETGDAVTANGEYSINLLETDEAINTMIDNISTIAVHINDMCGEVVIGPFVVATNNPGWKFTAADTALTPSAPPL